MKIVTTDTVAGYTITESLGTVIGNTIRARHLGKDISAGLRSLVGGEITEYTGMMAESREQALQRGLCGWVQNCSDGSVEVLAKGAENSLSLFKTWLWQGPSGSTVNEIHVTLEEEEPVPDTFYIR